MWNVERKKMWGKAPERRCGVFGSRLFSFRSFSCLVGLHVFVGWGCPPAAATDWSLHFGLSISLCLSLTLSPACCWRTARKEEEEEEERRRGRMPPSSLLSPPTYPPSCLLFVSSFLLLLQSLIEVFLFLSLFVMDSEGGTTSHTCSHTYTQMHPKTGWSHCLAFPPQELSGWVGGWLDGCMI